MKTLDLTDSHPNPTKLAEVQFLKPEELFYVRLTSLKNIPDNFLGIVKKACALTSEVILSIPHDEFSNNDLRSQFLDLGIKGFALRFTHQVDKWLIHQGIGQVHSGDRDIIHFYRDQLKNLPEGKDLIVEFEVHDDIRILAPTITGLYELGLKWAVLDVQGPPTLDRCLQMRDVFEYLKIRSCPRLNVYFAFWKSDAKEWDIKTQNTFAGLEYVHIDISNRCTHSCVFCGLYGPEAIEDMKVRAGGSIPAPLKDMMKMEINSEKCLKIIRSLPWSVKSIQFGGFGDPLMHSSAVEFIAAARRRGLNIEMLSNMEYLEEKDLTLLHELGGPDFYDLHFIANVSGGNSEIYIKTRPKQTEKTFDKVKKNLMRLSELRKNNKNSGVHFTIMCVVNSVNCHYLLDVTKFAHETGASRVWFKPMELHLNALEHYLPSKKLMIGMVKSLQESIEYAEKNGVEVFQKEYLIEIINKYSGETVDV